MELERRGEPVKDLLGAMINAEVMAGIKHMPIKFTGRG
jgi:hypothetical protein